MATPVKCPVCNRKVNRQAKALKCMSCEQTFHIKCLCFINDNDMEYLSVNQWICTQCLSNNLPFIHIVDEHEYLECIKALGGGFKLQKAALEKLVFHPFQNYDLDSNNPMADIDPDANFYNESAALLNMKTCQYYLEDKFNKTIEQLSVKNDNMSLMHLNIRSARKNLSQLENYLMNIQHVFSAIALTETWYRDCDSDLYCINGYQSECVNRTRSSGGGVALLIKDGLLYKRLDEFCVANENCEQLFVEFPKSCFQSEKSVIIGVIYRAPGLSLQAFNDHLIDLFSKLKTENKLLYITGDFNVNLLNGEQHLQSSEFLEILYENSCLPLITKPTRISNTRATLIDNVFTNDVGNNSFHGILYTDISDHLPIFFISKYKKVTDASNYVTYRQYSKQNLEKFHEKLKDCDWSSVYCETDAQRAYTLFNDVFSQIYNRSFPIKRKKIGYKDRKPWLTEALKISIKEKNRLYIQYKRTPSVVNKDKYRGYRESLLKLIKITERNYYNDLMVKYKNNMKKSWRLIKEIINKKRADQSHGPFRIKNKMCTDKRTIAQSFNNYFLNVGPSLAEKIPNSNENPNQYIKNNSNSMYVRDVTQAEILIIMKNFKDSSPGYDDVCPKYIKEASTHLVGILQYIFQLSLSQGVFPKELKTAKVIPLHKNSDISAISNYRPISILPAFSKVLERIMFNRIVDFIHENNILYDLQFGFRSGHSTTLALVYLVDKISSEMDKGNFVLGVFLDLRKAFDTVNHSLLLDKLYLYGIRGLAYDWLRSYLFQRKQFVYFNEERSNEGTIQCGVPQGSILGPLLFILYLNDLAKVSQTIYPLIFADDTNVFVAGKKVEELILIMNHELEKVMRWMNTNKLSLNIDKSNYMIFHSPKKKVGSHSDIILNNSKIKKIQSTKFLGVTIDDSLKWTAHMNIVKTKVAKAIGIISKARKIFSLNTLKLMYNTFVLPHLTYAIEVWGKSSDMVLSSLFRLQKRVVRLITCSRPREHSPPIFKSLNILNIYQLYQFTTILFVYKYIRKLLPFVFDKMFIFQDSLHNHDTRQAGKFRVPRFRLSFCQNTLRYNAVKIWNDINSKLDRKCCFFTFKKKLKHFVLSDEICDK